MELVVYVICILLAVTAAAWKYGKGSRTLTGNNKIPLVTYHNLISYLPALLMSPETAILPLSLYCTAKYGKILKCFFHGLTFVYLSSPDMIQKVLSSRNPCHLSKPTLIYHNMFKGFENGLVTSDVQTWTLHRKISSRLFTYNHLQRYLTQMNGYTLETLETLSRKVKNKQSFEFAEMVNRFIAESVLYVLLGSHESAEEEATMFYKAIQMGKEIVAYRLLRPWFLIEALWWFHPSCRNYKESLANISAFAKKVTTSRRDEFSKMRDGTEKIMESPSLLDEWIQGGLSDDDIRDHFVQFISAGLDTTRESTVYLMFFLALNPEHQELCRKEIDLVFDAKQTNSPDLTMDDVCNLKHLERCIFESQRMGATASIFARHLTEPLKLDDGLQLEADQWVFISPWALHKSPEYFPNPDTFDPDRFLPDNCKVRHPYAFIPFSAGPRNCIGYKFAMMQMKVFAAHTLSQFDVNTSDKLDNVQFTYAITLGTTKEINFGFKQRIHNQKMK